MLETFSSYVTSILKIPSYLYIPCTRIMNFRDNKEVCSTYKFLGSHSNPRGLECAHNTERASALPSAKLSLPRRLQRGEPPNIPKKSLFSENFVALKSLEYLEKGTQGVNNFGTRPTEPWDHLRLRDTAYSLTPLRPSSL